MAMAMATATATGRLAARRCVYQLSQCRIVRNAQRRDDNVSRQKNLWYGPGEWLDIQSWCSKGSKLIDGNVPLAPRPRPVRLNRKGR
jgi:hypothetical protein